MNAIVVKTKGSISDDAFLMLNEVRFKVYPENNGEANAIVINVSKAINAEILGNGYFVDANLTENLGKTALLQVGASGTAIRVVANEICYISIKDFHLVNSLTCKNPKLNTPTLFSIQFDDLIGFSQLINIGTQDEKCFGAIDIKDVENMLSKLKGASTVLTFNLNGLYGDISVFANSKASVKQFGSVIPLNGGLHGDIINLANLLVQGNFLQLTNNSNITGSVESLLDGIAARGRQGDQIVLNLVGTKCTYQNQLVAKNLTAVYSNGSYTVS